ADHPAPDHRIPADAAVLAVRPGRSRSPGVNPTNPSTTTPDEVRGPIMTRTIQKRAPHRRRAVAAAVLASNALSLAGGRSGEDEYTALQNAMAAGNGVPDVAQVEYYALPQFVLAESLADLSQFGAAELDGTFTTGPWTAVTQDDGVFALPTDSGPMALFYNKKVFEKHDIEVPTTWEEYVQAARDLHEADPNTYITADTGDAGLATSLIWQAGGRPFQVDGTSVTVDFSEE